MPRGISREDGTPNVDPHQGPGSSQRHPGGSGATTAMAASRRQLMYGSHCCDRSQSACALSSPSSVSRACRAQPHDEDRADLGFAARRDAAAHHDRVSSKQNSQCCWRRVAHSERCAAEYLALLKRSIRSISASCSRSAKRPHSSPVTSCANRPPQFRLRPAPRRRMRTPAPRQLSAALPHAPVGEVCNERKAVGKSIAKCGTNC